MKIRFPGNRGFTIVEVIVSIFLLLVGLLAVVMMQSSAIYGNRVSNELTEATYLAQQKLEEIKASTNIAGELSGGDQQAGYARQWTVSNTTGNARFVSVTVTWTILGTTRSVTLQTITRGDGY